MPRKSKPGQKAVQVILQEEVLKKLDKETEETREKLKISYLSRTAMVEMILNNYFDSTAKNKKNALDR